MRLIKEKTNINFLGPTRRKIALVVSVLLVVVSLVSLATRGLEMGIDFTGGILLEVGYSQPANLEEIRGNLSAAGFADAQVQLFGRDTDVLVRLPPQPGSSTDVIRERLPVRPTPPRVAQNTSAFSSREHAIASPVGSNRSKSRTASPKVPSQ